jgi:glutamine amidotransferase
MCVFTVSFGQDRPTKDQLENGCFSNPDGFGFVVVFHGGDGLDIRTHRSMVASSAISAYFSTLDELGGRLVAHGFHARIATHGAVDLNGCHPHAVGGDPLSFVLHNGVLDVRMGKGEKRSDTAVFAAELLPALGGVGVLDSAHGFDVLEDWTRGSKVAVFTADPAAGSVVYLVNEEDGFWDDETGTWFSNSSCEAWRPRFKASKWVQPVAFEAQRALNDTTSEQGVLGHFSGLHCLVCASEVWTNEEVCSLCEACIWCGGGGLDEDSDACSCISSEVNL